MTDRPDKDKVMANKSEAIKSFIEGAFPGTTQAIRDSRCPLCKKQIGAFRDDKSIREYHISGMCQACQDRVFGS